VEDACRKSEMNAQLAIRFECSADDSTQVSLAAGSLLSSLSIADGDGIA
jgi:hypothetical protein